MLSGTVLSDSEQRMYDSIVLAFNGNRFDDKYIEDLTNSGLLTSNILQKFEKPILCSMLFSFAKFNSIENINKIIDLNILTTEDLNSKHDDPNSLKGATSLFVAAKNGHVEVVKYLLNVGADPNLPTTESEISPLHAAINRGHPMVVKALFENSDINPYPVNAQGQTVFDYLESFHGIRNEEKRIEIENILGLEAALDDKNLLCPMQGQQWLTLFMLALNYPGGSIGGQCFGIANMSADALLTENGFANLNGQLKDMYKIVMAAKREAIKEINENKQMNTLPTSYNIVLMSVEKIDLVHLQQISKENGNQPVVIKHGDQISIYGESPGGQEWKITPLDATAFEGVQFSTLPKVQEVDEKILQEIQSKNGHPSPEDAFFYQKVRENIVKKVEMDQKKNMEIHALCDTVETYQSLYMHKDVLGSNTPVGQNVFLSSSLVEPIDLEQQGGKKGAFRCSGIYSEKELTKYLSSLRELFMKEQFPHPVSIQLSSKHAITISFDIKTDQWIYIDANRSQYITDNEKMSATILQGLSPTNSASNLIGIKSKMYIAAYNNKKEDNIALIKPFITELSNNQNWKEVHVISKETLNRKDIHGESLLTLAIKNGETKKAKAISKLTNANAQLIAQVKKEEKKFIPLALDPYKLDSIQEKKRFYNVKNAIHNFFKSASNIKNKMKPANDSTIIAKIANRFKKS